MVLIYVSSDSEIGDWNVEKLLWRDGSKIYTISDLESGISCKYECSPALVTICLEPSAEYLPEKFCGFSPRGFSRSSMNGTNAVFHILSSIAVPYFLC